MKFLKEDGTIEEGTPLTEVQVELRNVLEVYLHTVVCKNAHHVYYDKTPVCAQAGNFLALTVNNTTEEPREYAEAVVAKVEALKPKPAAEPEPSPAPVAVQETAAEAEERLGAF